MSSYHLQQVQSLKSEDYPLPKAFDTWFLQQSMWVLENPHTTQPHAAQERFSAFVWAGILGDYVIGTYLLPNRLDCRPYLIFFAPSSA